MLKALKECERGKIKNPKTNKCILIDGIIGRQLIRKLHNKSKFIEELKELEEVKINKEIKINIKNENNSCYLDSLLIALFHFRNAEIYNLFFKNKIENYENDKLNKLGILIQKTLLEIYNYINSNSNENYYCTLIRTYFNKYYNILHKIKPKILILNNSKENFINNQLDTFELLSLLEVIFNLKTKNFIKINENNRIINNSFIIPITADYLYEKDKLNIKEYIPINRDEYILDKKNYFKTEKNELVNKYNKITEYLKTTSFIFIKIYRNVGLEEKLTTKINFPDKIKFKENSNYLYIRSLIIHYGKNVNYGHYISVIKKNNEWYEYNDMIGVTKIKEKDYKLWKKYKRNIVALIYSF